MSPILVRPVREQLEHDRVIRLLQAKYKRKFDVGINPGHEQSVPVGSGPSTWYPDLVLHTADRGRRLAGVVEVETVESVNNLEAMSQWAALARVAAFHLYVPSTMIDVARRLCLDLRIRAAEIWAYHALGEQVRFTLVHRSDEAVAEAAVAAPAEAAAPAPAVAGRPRTPARRTAAPAPARPRGSRPAAAARPARSAPAGARRAASKATKAASTRRATTTTARKAAATATKASKRR